jgi:hypothetical protein
MLCLSRVFHPAIYIVGRGTRTHYEGVKGDALNRRRLERRAAERKQVTEAVAAAETQRRRRQPPPPPPQQLSWLVQPTTAGGAQRAQEVAIAPPLGLRQQLASLPPLSESGWASLQAWLAGHLASSLPSLSAAAAARPDDEQKPPRRSASDPPPPPPAAAEVLARYLVAQMRAKPPTGWVRDRGGQWPTTDAASQPVHAAAWLLCLPRIWFHAGR